ncbi:lipid droplet-associated protein [Klenkia sp. PcliD-1-E]|uniref:lipid droplet-associated protein n=1 Tax=Klenkia sp. PcliD-1-E TaxID=2954492 RepID=UPI00209730A6|nr:lipid droplet-associated protein [Klenkia sp. PcliD-1-E]MCO7219615.1 lipid droplet-associated protein [Klenkia sp. PcliD-1-E]
MAREIPEPVRAAAGLAATLLDEARKLPETLPGLPVRAIGLAMQTALKVQQEYTGLVARGDELLTGLRGEDEPGLATFDDDEDDLPPARPTATGGLGSRTSSFDRVPVDPEDAFAPDGYLVDDGTPADGPVDDQADDLADEPFEEPVLVVDEAAAIGDDDLADETLATEELLATGLTADLGGAALTDADVAALPDDPEADEITATVDELAVGMSDSAAEDDAVIAASEKAIDAAHEVAAEAPVTGYEGFTIAQLRGRLRGYQPVTVDELLAWEEAHQARPPFLTLLRNRKEKLAREQG